MAIAIFDHIRNRLAPLNGRRFVMLHSQGVVLGCLLLLAGPALSQEDASRRTEPELSPEISVTTDSRLLRLGLSDRLGVYQTDSKAVLGAALLEFLTPLPGLGQIYAGSTWWRVATQYIAFTLAPLALYGLAGFGPEILNPGGSNPVFGNPQVLPAMVLVGFLGAKIWGVFDAVRSAHRYNADLKIQLGLVPAGWSANDRW